MKIIVKKDRNICMNCYNINRKKYNNNNNNKKKRNYDNSMNIEKTKTDVSL